MHETFPAHKLNSPQNVKPKNGVPQVKATEARLLDLLKDSHQFAIPIYQRTYSWIERDCRQLWQDILRTGNDDTVAAHFMGSIVYIQQGLYQAARRTPLLVIDGQQRLTTITLLIAALANALEKLDEDKREPVDGFSPRKLRNYYLLNPEEDGERHYKLILSQTDKATLTAIVGRKELPKEVSIRVSENFKLFEKWIDKLGGNLNGLCKGLDKLVVVDIALSRDQDNPQLIFESMNSTGRELTQTDLIRNFILMDLESQLQTRLYEDYWRPMEIGFGQEAYASHFDPFMRHYLTMKTREIPNIRGVYDAFKNYAHSPSVRQAGFEALLADIRAFARYFCAIALGAESDHDLRLAFHDLHELKVDVSYPLLLELYHDYATGVLPREDFVSAIRMIESYVFRRAVCGIPTNSLNKTFTEFSKVLHKDRYLESIKANFLLLKSYRRFPSDDEFYTAIQTRDLYNSQNRRSYWLKRLENHNRKERVPVDEYTIEHILPQNKNLSKEWRDALGPNWEHIRETLLHTLGNLTLTGYNSEYSDRPFKEKRDMKGGFKESPLRLNQRLGTLDVWNEDAIRERAKRLATLALEVWPAPKLEEQVLDTYRPSKTAATYTIADHPYLTSGIIKEVFESLRREILSLDQCDTEEFLRTCVAYKAETNFVAVIPQARRLRLFLNIPFSEIEDPKGLCEDFTNIGHWGTGDVAFNLSSLADLPYAMVLIRQAFERQMGDL